MKKQLYSRIRRYAFFMPDPGAAQVLVLLTIVCLQEQAKGYLFLKPKSKV